jgi:hypothetical protein
VAALIIGLATSAGAQAYGGNPGPGGGAGGGGGGSGPSVAGNQVFPANGSNVSATGGGSLAFTGLEILVLVAVALALIAAGVVIYRASHRATA